MTEKNCAYCGPDKKGCGASVKAEYGDWRGRWHCTREHGHEGAHVACAIGAHELATWTEAEAIYDQA